MYKHRLILANQAFELGMTLPVNTSGTASTAMRVDGTSGRLAITVTAADGDVAIADTETMTLSYTECATEDGTFAAPAAAASVVTTYSAAYAPDENATIARLILPKDVEKYVKAVLATDDAAAAGTVDVFIEYLAG